MPDSSLYFVFCFRGPGGCFILVEIFTDNAVKFKQTLATVLRKGGGQYNDAKHLFQHKGLIDCQLLVDMKELEEDSLVERCTEHAIIAGAEDIQVLSTDDDLNIRFVCDPNTINQVTGLLEKQFKYTILSKATEYVPLNCVKLNENEQLSYEKLLDKIVNDPEVINIYDNVL